MVAEACQCLIGLGSTLPWQADPYDSKSLKTLERLGQRHQWQRWAIAACQIEASDVGPPTPERSVKLVTFVTLKKLRPSLDIVDVGSPTDTSSRRCLRSRAQRSQLFLSVYVRNQVGVIHLRNARRQNALKA
jgi:hypothetical protein